MKVRPQVLALALLSACRPDAPAASGIAARDSAGVRIVTLPDLASAKLPEWSTRVLFSSDSAAIAPLLKYTDARILADSSVLVANQGELLHFDPSGHLLGRIGRAGAGPGEFQMAFRLGISPTGEILVGDFSNQRVTLLDPTLRLRRIIPRVGPSLGYEPEPMGLLDGNRILVGFLQRRPNREEAGLTLGGHDRDSAPLRIFDSLGTLQRVLGVWPGLERVPTQVGRIPPAFARSAMMQSRGHYTAVTPTDSLAVTLFADTAVVLMVRGGVGTRQPTQQDVAGFEAGVREDLPDVVGIYLEALHRAATVPAMPALGGLAVDGEGNTWVGTTPGPADSLRTWFVISPSGVPLGRLSLPYLAAVAIPGAREVLDVEGDRLVLLRESPEGEISLELRQVIHQP